MPAHRTILLCAALVVGLGLVSYAGSFGGVFVLDDLNSIATNPNVRTLWPLWRAASAPRDLAVSGRPVASLSLAVNYALAPADARDVFSAPPPGYPQEAQEAVHRNAWGYHAFNLVVHLLAALTLFGLVRRTMLTPAVARRLARRADAASDEAGGQGSRAARESRASRHATWVAFAVAAVWVVHPLNTGAVTYITQRVESLMGLCYLLTLYCAIRAVENRSWSVCAVAACAVGMGCKEVMVTAPLMVVLYDALFVFAPRARGGHPAPSAYDGNGGRSDVGGLVPAIRAAATSRWPLYLGLAATWGVLAALVATGPRSASVGFGLNGWSSWTYLLTQAGVLVHYLHLAVVPWPLVLDYQWPMAVSLARVLPQALFLVVLLGLTAWGLLRLNPLAFAGAWFFGILAPSSSVLPIVTEVAAEHRMYLPLAGVVALLVVAGYLLLHRVPTTTHVAPRKQGEPAKSVTVRRRLAIPALALVVVVVVLAFLTSRRNEDYGSESRIWADAVEKQPSNARARNNYGTVLFRQQHLDEAEQQFRLALTLDPRYAEAHANLGAVLCSQGRLPDGVEHLQRAIEIVPTYADAYLNLGRAYAQLRRWREAADAYRRASRLRPDDPAILNPLAWILATSADSSVRDGPTAVELAMRALAARGGADPDLLDTLAAAYAEAGRFQEAAATARQALDLAQRHGIASQELADRLALYESGRKFREGP